MGHIQRIHNPRQLWRKLIARRDRQVAVRERPVGLRLHRCQRRRMFEREVPNARQMELVGIVGSQPRRVRRRRQGRVIRCRGEGAEREGGGGGGGRERGVGAGSSGDARDGRILIVGELDARGRLRPRERMVVVGHGRKPSGGGSMVRMRIMLAVGHMAVDGLLRPSVFALDLGGGAGEQVDVKGVPHGRPGAISVVAPMRTQHRAHVVDGRLIGVGRRDIGRAHGGGRGGMRHGLRGRHHHRRGDFVGVGGQGGHMM